MMATFSVGRSPGIAGWFGTGRGSVSRVARTSKSDIERAEMRLLSWPTEPYDEGGSFGLPGFHYRFDHRLAS